MKTNNSNPMKKKSNHNTFSFLGGLFLGLTIMISLSFTGKVLNPVPPVAAKISLQEAQSFTGRYYDQSTPMNKVIKGFAINKEQLDAMNRLSAENSSLAGFRIYMGLDNNNQPLNIVVGTTSQGSDNAVSIYKTASMLSGPCPTICDNSSTITLR
jgi:hypothetical protein